MPDFSIGVDLGGTNLRIAAISTDGQLLEKITLGVKVALGRDHVIGEMCDAIQRLTEKYRRKWQVRRCRHRRPGHHRHGNRHDA